MTSLAEQIVSARMEDLQHGAGACVVARRWPLRTLVAYLFDGRECDEVRAMLARGAGVAHGTRLSWSPVQLTVNQFTAIEHTFPAALPDRALYLSQATLALLSAPGLSAAAEPRSLPREHAPLAAAAARAAYLYFDYGPWADLYEVALSPEEAAGLLSAARAPTSPDADLELVVAPAAEPRLRLVVPRADARAPWRELPP